MYHVGDFGRSLLGLLVLAARPVEQFRPQVGLELEDLAADRWQWRFQLARRSRNAAFSIGITDVAFFWAARRQLLVANVVDPLAYAFGTIC